MATPHVTALVAAIRAVKGDVPVEVAQQMLIEHSQPAIHEADKVTGPIIDMPALMESLEIIAHNKAVIEEIGIDSVDSILDEEYTSIPLSANYDHIDMQVGEFVTIKVR